MRCLIVDDEEPARAQMRRLLSGQDGVEIVGAVGTVREALAAAAKNRPDVVFLDVKLRGETGFDFVGLAPEPLPHLVFVTAYDRYAVRGFECNALDYLLKPVWPERLAETLRRIRKHVPLRRRPTADDAVFLKAGSTARFVPWRDVRMIFSAGNYSRVFLPGDASFLVLRPLKEWIDLAPAGLLARIHRTLLLQPAAIREVRLDAAGRREVVLDNGRRLPVGRSYWPELKAMLPEPARPPAGGRSEP